MSHMGQVRTLSPSFSVCSARNTRPYMEDRFAINTTMVLYNYDHPDWQDTNGLFLICDGHAGSECAEFMVTGFVMMLPQMSKSEWPIQSVIEYTLEDLSFRWKQTHPDDQSGCTFVALLVNYKSARACVVNIGDSRVMQFDHQGSAMFSTKQHDLEDSVERDAIEHRVLHRTGERCKVKPDRHGTLRVGGLNMARALGDRAPYIDGCISSKPDISLLDLSLESETTFVMASDGLWDEVAIPISSYIRQQGSAQDIVRDVTLMKHPRARDNVTVMMIQFRPQHQQRPFQTMSGVPARNAMQLQQQQQQQQQQQHPVTVTNNQQSREVHQNISTQSRRTRSTDAQSSRRRQSSTASIERNASRRHKSDTPKSHKRKQVNSNTNTEINSNMDTNEASTAVSSSSARRGRPTKSAKTRKKNHIATKRNHMSNSNTTNTELDEDENSTASSSPQRSLSGDKDADENEDNEEEEEEEEVALHDDNMANVNTVENDLEDAYFHRIPTYHPHAQNTTWDEKMATARLASTDSKARLARQVGVATAERGSRSRSRKQLVEWPNQTSDPTRERPLTETRMYEVDEDARLRKVVQMPRRGATFQGLPPRTSPYKKAFYAPE